jgi:4-amino-4-deoxy-L-arabinose transferase-like glycosyltransferase
MAHEQHAEKGVFPHLDARAWIAAAACVAVLGVFVLTWRLVVPTLGVDEVVYIQTAETWDTGGGWTLAGHPPLSPVFLSKIGALFGFGLGPMRIAGTAVALVTAALITWIGTRLGGRWVGLIAAAGWLLLPQSPGSIVVRLDRYAGIHQMMVLGVTAATAAAVLWAKRGTTRWAIAAGFFLGLGAASKMTALVFLPILALVGARGPKTVTRRMADIAAAYLACLAALALAYAPLGGAALDAFTGMIEFQRANIADGHPLLIAGSVRLWHPWWSNWYWQASYLGWPLVLSIWGLAAWGLIEARRSASVRVVAGVLVLFTMAYTLLPVKLPHYHLEFAPSLFIMAAMGARRLWRAASRPEPRQRLAAQIAVMVALLLASLSIARNLVEVAQVERSDYAAASDLINETFPEGGQVLVWGWARVLAPYLDEGLELTDVRAPDLVAVVVDPITSERQRGTPMEELVVDLTVGMRAVIVDRLTVYIRTEERDGG